MVATLPLRQAEPAVLSLPADETDFRLSTAVVHAARSQRLTISHGGQFIPAS